MNKIEKINNFIIKNNIQGSVYSFNKILINNSNQYPEDYYAFEDKNKDSRVYDIHRDTEKIIYQGNLEEAFTLFLVKVLFLDYCYNNNLDNEIYNHVKKEIKCVDNVLYYKEYEYFSFPNGTVTIEEVERLNRRVCYLHMFLKELLIEGLIERKVEPSLILSSLSK